MKSIGEKVLGWFIVDEDAANGPPVVEVKAESSTTSMAMRMPMPGAIIEPKTDTTRSPGAVPSSSVHTHDARTFAEVYRAAGLPPEDNERLSKVLDLIASLPSEATIDVKRSIVGAALQAFAVPVDRVVAAAGASMTALDAHVDQAQSQNDTLLAQARTEIAKLEQEIASLRQAMDGQSKKQDDLRHVTTQEKSRIATVLDFFGRSAPITVASPRLVRLK